MLFMNKLSPSSVPTTTTTNTCSTPECSDPVRHFELEQFPNEVLLNILNNLDVQTLLFVCTLNRRLRTLAYSIFSNRLISYDDLRLRLYIDQENRWRFTLDMKLDRLDLANNTFTFVPVCPVACRVYYSALLRKPTLYKIALVGNDMDGSADHPGQFPIRPTSLAIKAETDYHQDNVTTHPNLAIDIPWSLDYTVSPTPPDCKKQRSGERWLTPTSLKLPMVAFFSEKPNASFLSFLQSWRVRDVPPKPVADAANGKKSHVPDQPSHHPHGPYFSAYELKTR